MAARQPAARQPAGNQPASSAGEPFGQPAGSADAEQAAEEPAKPSGFAYPDLPDGRPQYGVRVTDAPKQENGQDGARH